MKPERDTARIIGVAKITHYEVTFDSVSYTIAVKDCIRESFDGVEELPDYEIVMTIPFNEKHKLLHWLKNAAFAAMQESWQAGEDDCYFEHSSEDRAALMTLNGAPALIPVKNH